MGETRLDLFLVRHNLAPSRERAQAAIQAGMVLVNGKPSSKAAYRVDEDDDVVVTGDPIGYVGRGGLKLEGALERFELNPSDRVCLDVGASTGGFTECLLKRGARLVYAVDVGRDQLHPSLRSDPRVVVMESSDIRAVTALAEAPSLASIDVSFISLTQVLPSVVRLLGAGGEIIALIKPQFELGPQALSKKGVVRDPRNHQAAVNKVLETATALGLVSGEVMESPILGTEGNKEFLVVLQTLAVVGQSGD